MLRNELFGKTNRKIGEDAYENDVFRLRRSFEQQLREQAISNSPIICQKVRNIRQFIDERNETPRYICLCCGDLFFHNSVLIATQKEPEELAPNNSMFSTKYICSTCRKQSKSNILPKLAVKNGLEFPVLPQCLNKKLNKIRRTFCFTIY